MVCIFIMIAYFSIIYIRINFSKVLMLNIFHFLVVYFYPLCYDCSISEILSVICEVYNPKIRVVGVFLKDSFTHIQLLFMKKKKERKSMAYSPMQVFYGKKFEGF